MADSFDSDADWTPTGGFDGLPIPGLPPSAQPQALARVAPPQLPAAQVPPVAPMERPIYTRPAVERSVENYTLEPGVQIAAQPGFSFGSEAAPVAAAPPETSHSLGLALLLVTVGAGVGLKLGGAMGGVAGGLYGGSLVNAIRAARCVTHGVPDSDKEAMRSGTWALVGAGLASYLVYMESKKKKPARARANAEAAQDEPETEPETEESDEEPETEEDDK